MTTLLLILGLVLFTLLIVTHEMGHFWAAKRNGVEIEEFGLFFPPRIFKRKTKGGWLFSINLLPVGGFVKLKGEHDADTAKGSFGAASVKAKSKIMLAGIVVNLITAYLLFLLLAFIGMPHLVGNQFTVARDSHVLHAADYKTVVGSVEKNSPASRAGLVSGDTIQAIGQPGHLRTLSITFDLNEATKRYSGQTVTIRFVHAHQTKQATVQLRGDADILAASKQGKTIGHLGVAADSSQNGLTTVRSTWSAPIVAAGTMGQLTGITFESLGKALSGLGGTIAGAVTHNKPAREAAQTQASNQVSGPIGIFYVLKYGASLGIRFILMVIALCAMTLGVMNLLPIPMLDGGRLWLMLFTRAIKRPLSPGREEAINAVGFVVLMTLLVLISLVDIKRFH